MGLTLSQKILQKHTEQKSIKPGDLIKANIDLVLGNDITSPIAIDEFNNLNIDTVFDNQKIALVLDHFVPNKDIKSADQCLSVRNFANKHNIKHFFDVGKMGIEHALLPEQGIVGPSELIIGADSHTCTYGAIGAFSTGVGSTDMSYAMITGESWFKVPSAIKVVFKGKPSKWVSGKDVILNIIGMIGVCGASYKSIEFVGDGVHNLSIDDRFTISNMVIEAGAKNGIFEVDEITIDYLKNRYNKKYEILKADSDALYDEVINIDLSQIKTTVAMPHLPSNVKSVEDLGQVKIDQVVIGSCTNGRISDLRIAYEVLKGYTIAPSVRCIIIPATQKIYLQALKEGLIEEFIKCGAVVSTPTCGPCLGGYMGILAKGEVCLSTTNRNFVGRMGHVDSKIYLSNPAVAAASAIKGFIANP